MRGLTEMEAGVLEWPARVCSEGCLSRARCFTKSEADAARRLHMRGLIAAIPCELLRGLHARPTALGLLLLALHRSGELTRAA
jgi:hypothetical protein